MKRFIVVALLSSSALAAPVGETFTGGGIGMDVTTTKYKNGDLQGKQAIGINFTLDYATDYGRNLIGIIDGKAKLGSSNIFHDIKQKSQYSIGYAQGYRLLPDILPYVKLHYSISKISDFGSFKGIGYAIGVKYAISNDIEVGLEYSENNLKRNGTKLKGNAIGTNLSYRF